MSKTKKPPVDPSVKTARNSRRLLKTGTVQDILRLLPPAPVNEGPVNGPDLFPSAPDDTEATDKVYTRIGDRDVEKALKAIRSTGIVEFLDDLINTKKQKVGRPSRVTVEALLVAMWLAGVTERPMLLTEFRDILFHCIYPPMRNILDVRDGVIPRSPTPSRRRRWNKSAANAVGRTFNKMTAVIDPSDEVTQRKNVLWEDMKYRGLTEADAAALQALLDWVCNQLLLVTYNMLPESARRHDDGSRCIDATPIPMFTTSRGLDHPEAMSMPHASNYVRDGDHLDPNEKERSGTPERRKKKAKFFPALDAHLLITTDGNPGDHQRVPGIVTAMTTDRAALDPAGAARRLFASEINRKFVPGYLTGDGLYADAEKATFQIPAREAGYKLILPITKDYTGVQGAHPSGMTLVDGTYYCPAISDDLRTIIDDLAAKRIDQATFKKRILARKKFEMVTKQNADINGVGERLGCRASDHSLTVKCEHKPNSLDERLSLDKSGNMSDHRPPIFLPITELTEGKTPTICQVQAVTMKKTDGAKTRQYMPIGDEHTDRYHRQRQTQEGLHGFAKDDAKEALGASGRRRVRTKVAQQLFCAFLLAAANIRKIRTFIETAVTDKNGDLYVVRTPRKGDHARTGLPPGSEPPPDIVAA